ncbi:hypothetical protein L2X99_03980 [Microbacterium sp. KUDC0406]|uniref:hypothetical protein n=1 Tax=Microbacterium sp. KUDC0406 TaxID=2909588 RepID=UPI001F3A9266|nr:hypothetical protein [Microbacterium sp. KUDC0406]UJP10806.1 hypothetical protein L2X99_03980 [Microbacterium sp. KUDC0406]
MCARPDLRPRSCAPAQHNGSEEDYDRCMTNSAVLALPAASALFAGLHDSVGQLTDRILEQILAEEEAYVGARISAELLRHIVEINVDALLQTMSGGEESLDAAREAGREKAEHSVPLEGLLHAYRIAGITLWEQVVEFSVSTDRTELLLRASSDVWGVIDRFSNAAADAYRDVVEARDRRDENRRGVLMLALLDENTPARDAGAALRGLGLPEDARYAVIAAERTPSGADPLPGVEQRLRQRGLVSAWSVWSTEHVGIVALDTTQDAAGLGPPAGCDRGVKGRDQQDVRRDRRRRASARAGTAGAGVPAASGDRSTRL